MLEPRILEQSFGGDLDENAREDALRSLRHANFRRIAKRVRMRHRANSGQASLLDVGCAHGWFLREMAADFKVQGIEPDPNVANSAGRQGLDIRNGFFPDALQAGEKYDVIVFNDVLEHIPDVRGTLDACHRHLKSGGSLIVNAPDSSGFLYRLSKLFAKLGFGGPFGRLWQEGFPSPHVHYFSTASMTKIAGKHGFQLVESYRLPSVSRVGLYSRIRYSKDSSQVSAAVLTAVIGMGIPVLSLLPSDITVWVFRKV